MFGNLLKALGWSALLHLLVIAVLWYTHQPTKVVVQPKAIEAFVYQPIRPKPAPPAVSPAPVAPAPELPPADKPIASASVKTKPQVKPEKPVAARPANNTTDEANHQTGEKMNNSLTTNATHATQAPVATMSLAERSLAIATRHHQDISSATLATIREKPELRDRPATTSKPKLTPSHAAANVIMQLSDGSFIEKIGDYCYLAKPGADLRADIFSMKPVSCGENKNAAMYDRIMSKVGQDR